MGFAATTTSAWQDQGAFGEFRSTAPIESYGDPSGELVASTCRSDAGAPQPRRR